MSATEIQWNTTAEELVKIFNTNLTGKVVIITGANSGIGLETSRVLSSVGAKVIMAARNLEKAQEAADSIRETVSSADLVPLPLDLSDFSSIKAFSDRFLKLNLPLHILINNAGVMDCPESYTKDGFEMQFGVNHLGHFYLTQLLTDVLKSSAPSRIINVSSSGQILLLSEEGVDFDNLNQEKGYISSRAYAQSKLANILHAKELQRRFNEEGVDITVVSLHPGNVESNLNRHMNFSKFLEKVKQMRHYTIVLREMFNRKPVQVGASTNVYCAVAPDLVKGEFYYENKINTELLNAQANNQEMAKKLWEVSEELIASKTSRK